ncbi:low-density lipoprotein receptor-like [Rhagoletis pomonella]|uniref:low-density lipoprotein receptor-like n=1 Tax=Rhagoletis pomonella TaxID=28610 RepID=UPI0017802D20|nr:low-density lipoprotein receptor-like [Rhagoletis pomonella]
MEFKYILTVHSVILILSCRVFSAAGKDDGEVAVGLHTQTKAKCDDGTLIDDRQWCNGSKNCPDGSDELEKNCIDKLCTDFKCSYGGCIPEEKQCDQKIDCWDGKDEFFRICTDVKPCSNDKFQCGYGGCIDLDGKCNGKFDCPDHTDEYPPLCE